MFKDSNNNDISPNAWSESSFNGVTTLNRTFNNTPTYIEIDHIKELIRYNYPLTISKPGKEKKNGDYIPTAPNRYVIQKGVSDEEASQINGIIAMAEKGDADAQYWLGYHLLQGIKLEPNTNAAVDLIHKSAQQGNQNAIAAKKSLEGQ